MRQFPTDQEKKMRDDFVNELCVIIDANFVDKSDAYIGTTCCCIIEELQKRLEKV